MLKNLFAFKRYPEFAQLAWWRFVLPRYLRQDGLVLGRDVRFLGCPIISLASDSQIVIGDRANLCSSSIHTALGVNHPVVLRTLRDRAKIEIGEDTGVSGVSICAAVKVSIGANCLIGANVTIADNDFHAISPLGRRYNRAPESIAARPVVIEDNVFIGTGSIILKGVTVGRDSIVGAGSVVSSDVPPGHIYAGNPAKLVRAI